MALEYIMKNITLPGVEGTYDIRTSTYEKGGKIYMGLISSEDGYPYCDITENHTDMSVNVVDNDLVQFVFHNNFDECKKWLEQIPGVSGVLLYHGYITFLYN